VARRRAVSGSERRGGDEGLSLSSGNAAGHATSPAVLGMLRPLRQRAGPALPGKKPDKCLLQEGVSWPWQGIAPRPCLGQPWCKGRRRRRRRRGGVGGRARVSSFPCPLRVLGSGRWSGTRSRAGWLAGGGSQHPRQSAGTWHGLSWGGYFFFIIFFPLQDS